MKLTTDELRFFKRNGYLIKRNILNPELTERARARLWDGAPQGRTRDDPSTWVGPWAKEEENDEGSNHRRGFRWNFREPGAMPRLHWWRLGAKHGRPPCNWCWGWVWSSEVLRRGFSAGRRSKY